MPADTALSRVTKSDFFAILGSGTYVMASYGLIAAAVLNHGQNLNARATVVWLSVTIENHWPVAVASFFFAFLVGNMLRALPVNLVDNWSGRWFGWLGTRKKRGKTNEYHKALWEDSFPYGKMLELELKALKLNMADLDFSIPPEDTRHSHYNFWKAEICRESTAAFEFTQELEGRVRLFATMCWAALLGLVAGIVGILLRACGALDAGWLHTMFVLSALSALICFVFGSQVRRVRGQEVASVFCAYMSLILQRSRDRKTKEKETAN